MGNKKINIVLILFIFILCILFYRYIFDGTEKFKSNLDGNYYNVRFGKDSQKKADLLAFINLKLGILVSSLRNDQRYKNNPDVKRLLSNWDRGITIKEIGFMENDAAYVINKQHLAFCLQDLPYPNSNSKNTNIEDTNLITYVSIHELGHIMSEETGHGREFIKNFEFLLNYSKNLKYIDPFLNKEIPLYIELSKLKTSDNYCGVPLLNSIN
jgi:hypothetical protein